MVFRPDSMIFSMNPAANTCYVFNEEMLMQLADKWLMPNDFVQRCATEHSLQIRITKEKRISQHVVGSSPVEPHSESKSNQEAPTEAPSFSRPSVSEMVPPLASRETGAAP